MTTSTKVTLSEVCGVLYAMDMERQHERAAMMALKRKMEQQIAIHQRKIDRLTTNINVMKQVSNNIA